MKSLIKIFALVTSLISSSAALSNELQFPLKDRHSPAVSMAVCGFSKDLYSGTSEVVLLEKSNDSIPEPGLDMNCSEYLSGMGQFGARVKVEPYPCEAILPGTERYRMCVLVLIASLPPMFPW